MKALCEKVVEIRRVSDRVMVVVFEENVTKLICLCTLQSGRNWEEEQPFYDELIGELNMHSENDLVICFGDFNWRMGQHIDGFDRVRGEYGAGQRNY